MNNLLWIEKMKKNYCSNPLLAIRAFEPSFEEKRPTLVNQKDVMIHEDNTWFHITRITLQKIEELGWNKIPNPSYSPDLAPSDYYLFRSLQNHFKETAFVMQKVVKTGICDCF